LSSIGDARRLAASWLNPDRPSYLIYFVTARCNAKCETCFYWRETAAASARTELQPDELQKISEHLPPLVQFTLSGGEPFMRSDIFELVRPVIEKCRPVYLSIPTNGIMTGQIVETVERLAASYPWLRVNLELSIDGIGKDHDRIRARIGTFEELSKTWQALKAIHPKYKNLRLSILTVLSAMNSENIFELLNQLKAEMRPDRQEVMFPRGNPRNPASIEVPIKRFKEVSEWLDREAGRPSGFLDRVRAELAHQKRELIINTVARDRSVLPCLAGRKLVVIEPDGRVRPCEMLESVFNAPPANSGLEDFSLGSLRENDYDLLKILNGERARKLRGFISNSACHCSYECAALADLAFKPEHMARVFLKALV